MKRLLALTLAGVTLAGVGAGTALADPISDLAAGTASAGVMSDFDALMNLPGNAPSGWYTSSGEAITVAQAMAQQSQPGGLSGNGYTRTPTTVAAGSPTPAQATSIRTGLAKARTAMGRFPTAQEFFPNSAANFMTVGLLVAGAPAMWQQGYWLGGVLAERVGLSVDHPAPSGGAFPDSVIWEARGVVRSASGEAAVNTTLTGLGLSAANLVMFERIPPGATGTALRQVVDMSQCNAFATGSGGANGSISGTTCSFTTQAYINAAAADWRWIVGMANAGLGHWAVSTAQSGSTTRKYIWWATPEEWLAMSKVTEQESSAAAKPGDRTISPSLTTINGPTRITGATTIMNGDTVTKTWVNNYLDPVNEPELDPDVSTPPTGSPSSPFTVNFPSTTVPTNPGIDFSPITDLDGACSFPFGFLCYAQEVSAGFDVAEDAPVFDFDVTVPALAGGGTIAYTVDLNVMDDYMGMLRGLISFVLWIGAVYWLAVNLLGFRGGGDPGEAADEALHV